MRHSALVDLYRYWDALRGARAAPDRLEIDPAAIRHMLNYTFILETDREIPFNIRLAGGCFNALWAREMKGRPLAPLFGDAAGALKAGLWTVMDGAAPLLADVLASPQGYPDEEFEMLFLPLRHSGTTHSRILGACASEKKPSWMGLLPVGALKLHGLHLVLSAHARRSLPLLKKNKNAYPQGRFFSPKQYGRFKVFHGGLAQPPDSIPP